MKTRYVILLAGGVIAALAILSLVDVIPPVDMTRTAMVETFVRIQLYAQSHGKIPESLDVLPKRDGYDNRTTDGWGRRLGYSVDAEGVISLKSLGRNGLPGGSGKDTDIEMRYRTRDADGRSLMGDREWIATAELREKP